ncbi:MAG: DUF58 domain-containing protein [Planctomycetota bacterium]
MLTDLPTYLGQLPWLMMVLLLLPLVIMAWRYRIFPTLRWTTVLTLSIGLALVTLWNQSLAGIVYVVDGLFVVVLGIDLILLLRCRQEEIEVHRSVAKTASLGVALPSCVTITNRSAITLRGQARDDLPENFNTETLEHRLHLPRMERVSYERKLVPQQRGAFQLESVFLQLFSPLGLWRRHMVFPETQALNVYPDMKQLADYALLARTNRLSLIGVRRTRRIGQDSDFERLRDYNRDDNFRHIDWRSTARRRKLTVRQFQTDQSQRIIFMLDCGRMMTNERDGRSLLDHALNSALMMSYVALAQGDSVGMLCFSDDIHTFLPPRGGSGQMNRLIKASFDQFPRMVESRYDSAFLHLNNFCKRRSLVVLATNVIDEVNAGQIVSYMSNLAGRHLPLGILLRDRQMFDAADNPQGGDFEMMRAAVAADILLWRQKVISDLTHRGVLIVDEFPDQLTAPLVNQYLEVKAKHLL